MYGSTDYKSVDMENSNGATYAAVIAARELKVGTLEYYIEASDGVSLSYLGSAATPKTVEVETSAKIISVGNNSGNAGKEMVSTINGVNLTDDIEVYIDGNKIPSTYVSDKEIQIKYTPEYLGVKKVELKQNGELISSLNNALTIKDDSINVNYAESAVGTINSTQYIGLLTNFKGKIESLEIETTSESQYYAQSIYYTLTDITDYVGSSRVQTATYSGNQYVKGGRLANMCVYNAHNTVMPQILSIKINGIQVDISTLDETNVSFYTSDTYKPVEKVDVTLSKTGIAVGDTFTATYKINPTNACVSTAYANYSNNLVMNDDGTFTAIGSGSAWIEYYANSVCGTAYMDITPLDVTEIVAEKYNYSGIVGQEITINVTANPIESDKNLDWCYYGDANVDIISTSNNGRTAVIKLLSAGTNKIEVSAGNVKQSFNVVIKTNAAYVDITEEITTLKPEQSKTIAAEIKNNNDAELKLLWTSSNANVAKVDANGKVTAVGKGFAIITATVEGSTQSDTIMVLVGTDSMSYIMGDLNMDGKVTSADAMLALKLILDTKCNDAIMKIADVNSDGYITSSDAMLILQFATGKITSFN